MYLHCMPSLISGEEVWMQRVYFSYGPYPLHTSIQIQAVSMTLSTIHLLGFTLPLSFKGSSSQKGETMNKRKKKREKKGWEWIWIMYIHLLR